MAVGTGAVNGVFYPVGEGLCRMVNEGRLEHGYRCLAYPTGAAVYNIQAIGTGELDLGITYENLLREAYAGTGSFAGDEPMRDLRIVTALYPMPAVIIVNQERLVSGVGDLAGLRINVGNIGSGKRTIADAIFKAMAWGKANFSAASELDTNEVEKAFCRGEVDVMIEAMAMDSDFIKKVTSSCNGKFMSIPDEVIKKILGFSPGLDVTVIPGGKYPHNPEDIQTLSINAVLATSARVRPEAIYVVTGSIFSSFKEFHSLHSALAAGNKEWMLEKAKSFPLHDGVIRFCEEHGLPCR